jgi:hypothetical protein
MLATDAWTKEFSGKEIVDALWHKVWTHNNRNRIEFFRSVAESQRIRGLPAEVTDLQKTLHARR